MVLFIMLYKVVLTFESVNKILKCDHLNESSAFLLGYLLCCARWFWRLSLWMKSYSVNIQMKSTEQYFPMVLFIMLYKVVRTF